MRPRPHIRGREPPPPPAGRYRRRSPGPSASPRHYRRSREPPPPPAGGGSFRRRSPERPRRQEKCFSGGGGGGARRSNADILLEAGRLAAEYLVSKGLLPEHSLPGRDTEPKSNGDAEAGGGYRRKRSDAYHDDDENDPRWRRNGGGGDWGREEEKMPRRSGWDRRSYSSNGRYNGGGDGLEPGRRRRSHEFEEFRSRSMSRSSDRDRWSWGDGGGDVEADGDHRRGRSRSRSYFEGGRRDSDSRVDDADLDCGELRDGAKLPDSGNVGEISRALYDGQEGMGGDSDPDDVFRVSKRPRSLVTKMNDNADQSPASEGKNTLLDGTEDASDAKNDENAGAASINLNADGMDIPEHKQSDANVANVVRLSESLEEPVDEQCKLSNVETDAITDSAQGDACLVQPVTEKGDACLVQPVTENSAREEQNDLLRPDLTANNSCSQVEDVMEAPEVEAETDADISSRDKQQPPALFRIFDLNLVESHEMSEIARDPAADHLCNSVPDLIGGMDLQVNNGTSETQCTDGHAADNHHSDNGRMILTQGTEGHSADNHCLDNGQMILTQGTDGHAADHHHLGNGRMIPIIHLDDDDEEQYDTEKFSESKSEMLHKHIDSILPEHVCSQDQHIPIFSDLPHTNIPASSSIKQNLGNLWTGKGSVSAQGIPGDDDVLYVAFEKIPLEVINVWDLPSTELGESL